MIITSPHAPGLSQYPHLSQVAGSSLAPYFTQLEAISSSRPAYHHPALPHHPLPHISSLHPGVSAASHHVSSSHHVTSSPHPHMTSPGQHMMMSQHQLMNSTGMPHLRTSLPFPPAGAMMPSLSSVASHGQGHTTKVCSTSVHP